MEHRLSSLLLVLSLLGVRKTDLKVWASQLEAINKTGQGD